jgi:hypothetical protein
MLDWLLRRHPALTNGDKNALHEVIFALTDTLGALLAPYVAAGADANFANYLIRINEKIYSSAHTAASALRSAATEH